MRLRLRVPRRLQSERGMALIMAIGITSVLGIAGATAVAYSTSGAQESQQSGARQNAFSLAEAGINDSMAVLNLPTNNALDPDTLNKCTSNETKYGTTGSNPTSISSWRHDSYANGTVDWCGTLNRSTAQWYLTSIGNMKNPGRSGYVTRTLQATVSVVPTLTQPLNNPSWNYIYATHTGSTCDQTLSNNVSGGSWMYVAGNLCLSHERRHRRDQADRRRQPRSRQQRLRRRQHQHGDAGRGLRRRQLPLPEGQQHAGTPARATRTATTSSASSLTARRSASTTPRRWSPRLPPTSRPGTRTRSRGPPSRAPPRAARRRRSTTTTRAATTASPRPSTSRRPARTPAGSGQARTRRSRAR